MLSNLAMMIWESGLLPPIFGINIIDTKLFIMLNFLGHTHRNVTLKLSWVVIALVWSVNVPLTQDNICTHLKQAIKSEKQIKQLFNHFKVTLILYYIYF